MELLTLYTNLKGYTMNIINITEIENQEIVNQAVRYINLMNNKIHKRGLENDTQGLWMSFDKRVIITTHQNNLRVSLSNPIQFAEPLIRRQTKDYLFPMAVV